MKARPKKKKIIKNEERFKKKGFEERKWQVNWWKDEREAGVMAEQEKRGKTFGS